jgi:RND family efflux transporter MFP subunit
MRYSEPKQPGQEQEQEIATAESNTEKLRREVEDLRRQLREQKGHGSPSHGPSKVWHPSAITLWSIFLVITVLIVVAFFAGYLPLQKRNLQINAEAQEQEQALPRVEVTQVGRSTRNSELELPGNIQAVTEAPILARADGYIRQRMVDIGDRVGAGQPLAEIEAPELDQQVQQAKASLQQAQAALEQALANYQQGKANMDLARVTAERWSTLTAQGVVSRQDNDQYQAQYLSQAASVQALEKAIAAQRSNIAAAQANLTRLDEMQGYRVVKAPFDGVVTLRNVDVGALVNTGNTLLFRIAQTGTLRTYVSVPQTNASSIRVGQSALLSVSNLPGRRFTGTVARTANALDPNTRTLLVEVEVPNKDGALLPGMYAQVGLNSMRANQPLLIPGDALIARAEGTQVAIVRPDHTVHLQKVNVGRDYGDRLEVVGGLKEGDMIVLNPGDAALEGLKVNPVASAEKPSSQTGPKRSGT